MATTHVASATKTRKQKRQEALAQREVRNEELRLLMHAALEFPQIFDETIVTRPLLFSFDRTKRSAVTLVSRDKLVFYEDRDQKPRSLLCLGQNGQLYWAFFGTWTPISIEENDSSSVDEAISELEFKLFKYMNHL